jgi:hypothetical protein
MIRALADRKQQIGLLALLVACALLYFGLDRRLVLFSLLISVLASSRYAWEQIRIYGKHRSKEVLAAGAIPMTVCFIAIAIVVWNFRLLVSGST